MLHSFTLALLSWLLPAAPPAPQPAFVDACKIYGAIYVEKSRSFADYTVYIEEDGENYADVVVFKEENKLFADQAGLWYFVDDPAFANFRIAFTGTRGTADFKIAYTTKRAFAGCRQ